MCFKALISNAENLLSQCARFLLRADEARPMLDDMEANVRTNWYQTARESGVSEADCGRISSAFVYEGFRLELPREFGTNLSSIYLTGRDDPLSRSMRNRMSCSGSRRFTTA